MKFCLFLALSVRVTSSLGEEMGDKKVVEAKSQDIVVAQLDICSNESEEILVARLDICQNKSSHLMDEEHQIFVKGEKMSMLNYSISISIIQ